MACGISSPSPPARQGQVLTGQNDGHQEPKQQEQQAGQQEDAQPGEVAVRLQPSGAPACGWVGWGLESSLGNPHTVLGSWVSLSNPPRPAPMQVTP